MTNWGLLPLIRSEEKERKKERKKEERKRADSLII
jgi:hypothetical protein